MPSTEPSIASEVSATISSRSKAPVFVLGSPRSGTTLLYHMLVSAGNFANYRAESQVFNLLEPRFGDLRIENNRQRMLHAWLQSRLFTATGLDAEQLERQVESECRSAGDFLRIVMESMARQQGAERWADCTPEHLLYLRRIKSSIPNALVIHIIRDGRDVALSMARQGWIRPFSWDRGREVLASAFYWEWIVEKGRETGPELGADYLEVHFEDLVANPQQMLAKVSRFIEQDLDYERIRVAGVGSVSEPNSSFEDPKEDEGFAPVARWKRMMPREQLADVQIAIGDLLGRLGYEQETGLAGGKPESVRRIRHLYRTYFEAKFLLKARTPLGRWLVTKDLSWV